MILEVKAERESRRERYEVLLAGLPTSAVYNTLRTKKSDHVWQPHDFVKERPREMTVEEATLAMRAWASDHNKRHQA